MNQRILKPNKDGRLPLLMTTEDVAFELGVGVSSVAKLRSSGELNSVKVLGARRFRRSDVERYINERAEGTRRNSRRRNNNG